MSLSTRRRRGIEGGESFEFVEGGCCWRMVRGDWIHVMYTYTPSRVVMKMGGVEGGGGMCGEIKARLDGFMRRGTGVSKSNGWVVRVGLCWIVVPES